ncbi:hypothetical protein Cgig2_023951 [Carnegiea gigantea]|uniref:NAB domain-containing protein n=1 Tax=Carnegiea gigantea TaxID=171969 RepID=A0A9Q1K9Z4_9CARY|nr:hypothetical protein Cgig2_023951 [Carnegiea gigantea]
MAEGSTADLSILEQNPSLRVLNEMALSSKQKLPDEIKLSIEMDKQYKHMLELIDGDGDSFAKKAEMYYQRRPELISHVEELYRMYKLLADRYEHLTGEFRKNLLPDLQAQGSVGSDTGSEVTSALPLSDPKASLRRSGPRAAGFDFFLGRSVLDRQTKGDETCSISDSETESDASSLYSYPGVSGNTVEEGQQEQQNNNGSMKRIGSESFDDVHSKIVEYEEELRMAKDKIRLYEAEIDNLKMELQKSASLESASNLQHDFTVVGNGTEEEKFQLEVNDEKVLELQESNPTAEVDASDPGKKIGALVEELKIAKSRLHALDKEVIQLRKENKESSENLQRMQDLLRISQQEVAAFKRKFESEKRQASKLQERIARYKASLTDREHEVRELKDIISDANRKYQLHAEISRLTDEKTRLEEKLREWEMHSHTLETRHEALERKLNEEIEHLRTNVAEKTEMLEALKGELDAHKLKYDSVMSEKDELKSEISARNNHIDQLEKQLQHLVAENGRACKELEELRSREEELRREVERQKVLISEGAEGKREAIRQLCFSLEHYRNGYQELRQAFMGHKQHHVLAS